MRHEKAEYTWAGMSNAKHKHNTRRGTRFFNHWFQVFRCPVCNRMRPRKSRAKYCTGDESTMPPRVAFPPSCPGERHSSPT